MEVESAEDGELAFGSQAAFLFRQMHRRCRTHTHDGRGASVLGTLGLSTNDVGLASKHRESNAHISVAVPLPPPAIRRRHSCESRIASLDLAPFQLGCVAEFRLFPKYKWWRCDGGGSDAEATPGELDLFAEHPYHHDRDGTIVAADAHVDKHKLGVATRAAGYGGASQRAGSG